MSEIQKLKERNERFLEHIEYLEEQLKRSAYYKEGHYDIQAVERGHIIEKLEKEIKILNIEVQKLKDENKILRENSGTKALKIHNERGAGRKPRVSDQDKETMKMYRIQGKTIKEIAEIYDCSVGLVHKIINEI